MMSSLELSVSNTHLRIRISQSLVGEAEKNCRSCAKPVFKMEEMKAERNIWHRTCFKCTECAKQLK